MAAVSVDFSHFLRTLVVKAPSLRTRTEAWTSESTNRWTTFLCELAQARWTTTPVLAVGSLAPARSSREWNPLSFIAMVSGGWFTEAWMAPEYMAAMRF